LTILLFKADNATENFLFSQETNFLFTNFVAVVEIGVRSHLLPCISLSTTVYEEEGDRV